YQTRADAVGSLIQSAHVAGVFVVVDDLFTVCHNSSPNSNLRLTGWRSWRTRLDQRQCAAYWMDLMSTPCWYISSSGDISRKRATLLVTSSPTKSTSSSVLKRPMPKRIEEWAKSSSRPMLCNT